MTKKPKRITRKWWATPLYNLLDIQGTNGNWNYDEYQFGLYNGIAVALAAIERRAPRFKNPPKRWLNKNICRNPNSSTNPHLHLPTIQTPKK